MAKEKVKPNQFYAANAKKIQANRPASLRLSGVQNKDRQELLHRRCSWGGINMHCEIAARRSVFFVVSWHHLLPCEGCYIFKKKKTHTLKWTSTKCTGWPASLTCISHLIVLVRSVGLINLCRSVSSLAVVLIVLLLLVFTSSEFNPPVHSNSRFCFHFPSSLSSFSSSSLIYTWFYDS